MAQPFSRGSSDLVKSEGPTKCSKGPLRLCPHHELEFPTVDERILNARIVPPEISPVQRELNGQLSHRQAGINAE